MKNFFKITKGKIILFVIFFILTLGMPNPFAFMYSSNDDPWGSGLESAPLLFTYAFLVIFEFGSDSIGLGKALATFFIPHILIVYFITCLIVDLYTKFRNFKKQK